MRATLDRIRFLARQMRLTHDSGRLLALSWELRLATGDLRNLVRQQRASHTPDAVSTDDEERAVAYSREDAMDEHVIDDVTVSLLPPGASEEERVAYAATAGLTPTRAPVGPRARCDRPMPNDRRCVLEEGHVQRDTEHLSVDGLAYSEARLVAIEEGAARRFARETGGDPSDAPLPEPSPSPQDTDSLLRCGSRIPVYRMTAAHQRVRPVCFRDQGHGGMHRSEGGWTWSPQEVRQEQEAVVPLAGHTILDVVGKYPDPLVGPDTEIRYQKEKADRLEATLTKLSAEALRATRENAVLVDQLAEANARIALGESREAADHSLCMRNETRALEGLNRAARLRGVLDAVLETMRGMEHVGTWRVESLMMLLEDYLDDDDHATRSLPSLPYGAALKSALTAINEVAEVLDSGLIDEMSPDWRLSHAVQARDMIRDLLQAMVDPADIPDDPQPERSTWQSEVWRIHNAVAKPYGVGSERDVDMLVMGLTGSIATLIRWRRVTDGALPDAHKLIADIRIWLHLLSITQGIDEDVAVGQRLPSLYTKFGVDPPA